MYGVRKLSWPIRDDGLPTPSSEGAAAHAGSASDAGTRHLNDLASLLFYVFGRHGDAAGWAPEALVAIEDCAPLEPGLYRYLPSDHGLAPESALVESARGAGIALRGPGAAAVTILLATSTPTQTQVDAWLHRLAMTAAELDLTSSLVPVDPPHRPGEHGIVSVLSIVGVLGLDWPRADAASIARSLLAGGGRDAVGRRVVAMLGVARPWCATPLFSYPAWQDLELLAGLLRFPGRDVGLECRLGADPRVDLAVAWETRLHGAPRSRELHLPDLPTTGDWDAIDRLRTAWQQTPELCWSTRHLGFELDTDSCLAPLAAPGVFVGLLDGSVAGGARAVVRGAIDAGLTALHGDASMRSLADAVGELFDALPNGSAVHYFGAFPSRAPGVARFNLQLPPGRQARRFLARLGYPQPEQDLVAQAESWGVRVVLALDVGAPPPRRLGIELLFDRPAGLAAVLDRLVARGLCLPEKRQAVLDWPRVLQEPTAGWPAPLSARARRFSGTRSALVFKLSHLKLVSCQGALEAKAYLQLQHAWVPAASLAQRARASASTQSTVDSAAEPK